MSFHLSRRDVLAVSAGAAAALSLGSVLAEDKKKPGLIDAHSHIWTRDVKKFPLAPGQTVDDLAPPSFTAEELLKIANPVGVDRVVLIAHHTYYSWDNGYLIDAARRMPKTFRVVGMIDDTADRPDQQMRALLKQHVTGFRITPRLRGAKEWLSGPGMESMWKTGADTGQPMCCLIDVSDLDGVDAMCKKHPDTPVVIDHFARIGVDGEIRKADVKKLCSLAKHKHTSVKLSAYYALGKKKPPYLDLLPMIQQVVDAYGPERCMWASDCPYQLDDGQNYPESIDLIRKHADFLTKSDRQHILQSTAERVFFYA